MGGQPSSRGVVAAANYEARKYGVFSAMPTSLAVKKCPNLIIIKPRGELYSSISREIHGIFHKYTPIIEPLSLDEAFLDVKGSERLHGDAIAIGSKIKSDIKQELELVASVGVAPNKFLAKLASDHDKPDGFTVIQPEQVQSFLDPLAVSKIWGVGKKTRAKLEQRGIYTVADVRRQQHGYLTTLFGQYGEQLWKLCHGIDQRQVVVDGESKSVSQETTFDTDVSDLGYLEAIALQLTETVGFRLRQSEIQGRTVTVKIRFEDFRTLTRSKSMDQTSSQTDEIWQVVKKLIQDTLAGSSFSVRLIGVGVANFSETTSQHPGEQQDLFTLSNPKPDTRQGEQLDALTDSIKHRFGKRSIKRGKSIT